MRSRIHRLGIFIFIVYLVPLVVLAGVFYTRLEAYNPNLEVAEEIQEEAESLPESADYMMYLAAHPDGTATVFSTDRWRDILTLSHIQPGDGELLAEYTMPIELDHYMAILYQEDELLFAYHGDPEDEAAEPNDIFFYRYRPGSTPERLPGAISYEPHFDYEILDNHLYVFGSNESSDEVIAIADSDGVEVQDLTALEGVEHVTAARFASLGATRLTLPVLDLSTYDGHGYLLDLGHRVDGSYVLTEQELGWGHEEVVLERYFASGEILQRPEDARIEQELFYPKLYWLGGEELAIVGATSTADDSPKHLYRLTLDGEQVGEELSGLSPEGIPALDNYRTSPFNIQLLGDTLYVSSDESTTTIDLATGSAQTVDQADYAEVLAGQAADLEQEAEQVLAEGEVLSVDKAVSFVRNDHVALNLLIGFAIILLVLPLGPIIMGLYRRYWAKRVADAKKHGGGPQRATILGVSSTGVRVNDSPLAALQVELYHSGRRFTKEVRMVADMLNPPQVGDRIEVIYDPKRDEAFIPK